MVALLESGFQRSIWNFGNKIFAVAQRQRIMFFDNLVSNLTSFILFAGWWDSFGLYSIVDSDLVLR